MRSTYEQSKLKLDSLKRYVDNLDTLNWVILKYSQGMFDGKPTLDINLTEKKVYDYSLAIIQLYGIFENFLECIVCAYLSALSKQITLYQNLPETVREHNLSLSAKLLGNNFSKYDSVTPEELVRNLHSCFDVASDSYCLNITAFRQHASNFREDSMREFLHNAGICNVDKMISTNEKLKAFFGITSGESVPLSKYFEYLKDLVQRRNIVAHGEMEDNILSSAWLKQYIEYISLLMDSIYGAVLDTYYALMIKNGSAKYLGQPIETFGDSIVGINSKNTAIKVGHILIARNAKGVLYWGKIESMQINNIPTEEVTAEQAVAIGIKTTFKVKPQYNYYIYWDKYV